MQAAVTEQQIVIAAEVNTDPQDFGHLGPMMSAVQRELERVGVTERIGVVVADAGYWHLQQMDELAAQGIPVLIPPDSKKRKTTRPGVGRRPLRLDAAITRQRLRPRGLRQARQTRSSRCSDRSSSDRNIDRFQRRGRTAVRSEWRLAAMTHNLLKLHEHGIATAGP